MPLAKSIRDNLQFLLAETGSHLALLKEYLTLPSASIPSRLLDRQGYVENLKLSIHNHCLRQMASSNQQDSDHQLLRAVEGIATHLERVAELSREAVMQTAHLQNRAILKVKDYLHMIDQVSNALEMIEPALTAKDTRQALKIGKVEQRLDNAYQKQLKRYSRLLKKEKRPADRITLIMLAHKIEQMGNALLRISEAIISVSMGQHFNTDRYHAFAASITELKAVNDVGKVQVEAIAETKSGSAINAVTTGRRGSGYDGIFKDGRKRKLKEEKQRVNDWHDIFPGLAPKILAYQKRGDSAALLIEHLAGQTIEQILLDGSDKLLQDGLNHLTKTLTRVWLETRTKKPVSAGYMKQLAKRMEDVYAIHPEFRQPTSQIGSTRLLSFDQLLERMQQFESGIKVPFSVYIHGDFNVDNIIFDPDEKRINFIDLHRSRYMDYLQDVSVFMVSNYRLQVFDPRVRQRIMELCRAFYRFARAFARKTGDETFEIRLAMGLIRSFATSTRFILDKSLSRRMFFRATYLMEKLLEIESKPKRRFQVPIKEIFIG
ncbi:MAG: phosphotransferase [Candidatus Thiodiazotropha sp. (ex Cardiolucina cf. quadrata)]|nr:phosphotransferase [Candidatus Thiodiazotropha sp. (ex Cardiolucina cf. quadrata)]